jgi:hypothetical protein
MQNQSFLKAGKAVAAFALLLLASTLSAVAEREDNGKILGGYFEEWSIYYATSTSRTSSRTVWPIS